MYCCITGTDFSSFCYFSV